MKIIDVKVSEPFVIPMERDMGDAINKLTGPGRRGSFVQVFTDEGITGVAVVGGGFLGAVNRAIIEGVLKPQVVGEDPLRTEKIWEKMWWSTFNAGRRGAAIIAMSSIDIAIWDIRGKAVKQPVWKLLGGHRSRVAAYGSGINTNYTLEELVKQETDFVRDGFKAVKMKVGRRNPNEILERVKAVRDAIGSEVALMVDANNGWSVQTAIKMVKKMERYEIYWLEEPIIADDIEGYAKLCASTDIPIATGESHYTKYDFKELIERKAVDIVQADAAKVGGITEWMKVAAIAEAFGLPIAPHAYSQIHTSLVAAVPNGLIVECIDGFMAGKPYQLLPWRDPILPKNGYVQPIDKPGLGLEIDEEAVREYRARPVASGRFSTARGRNWPPFL